MQCPRCKGQMSVVPVDERTSKRVCQSCGHTEIAESRDAVQNPGRKLLTDDMPSPAGQPING